MRQDKYKVKCIDCGSEFEVAESSYNSIKRKNPDKPQFRCKECMKKYRSEIMKKFNAERTPEQKAKQKEAVSNFAKNRWKNMTAEEKEKYMKIINDKSKEWRENETYEEREWISKIHSESNINRWNKKTDEEKKLESIRAKEWWKNLSAEEKEKWSQKSKDNWNNISPERRKEWIKKIIGSGSAFNNNLSRRFEVRFSKSSISNLKLIKEYHCGENEFVHSWDYALINDKSELQCIIDLDGSFYHGDKSDYDGIHSKEEYDERRGLSIPDGVKWCIINSDIFEECFSYLEKIILLSYDEFISLRFKEYSNMPFPQPQYTDGELIRSFESLQRMDCNDKYHQNLSLNTRLGDRIIQHFHTSLYDEAQSAWKNDDILYDLTVEHAIYQSYLNKNKILQGLNVSDICPIQRILSPAKVKMIINKYLNEYNEIFNPYNIYSEIMLACIATGKRYIGKDCNIERLNESNKIAEFLQKYGIQMDVSLYSNIDNREFECILTEIYDENDIEDIVLKYKCKYYIFIINDNIIEIKGD